MTVALALLLAAEVLRITRVLPPVADILQVRSSPVVCTDRRESVCATLSMCSSAQYVGVLE
jgi:hypothetical protein